MKAAVTKRLLVDSARSPSRRAASRMICIMTARTTDAPAPVMNANRMTAGMAAAAPARRRRNSSRKKPEISETFMPETAMTCDSPTVRISSSKPEGSLDLSPRISERRIPASPASYSASSLSPNQCAHRAGST